MLDKPKSFAWNYCAICGAQLEPSSDGEKERPYCRACNRFYYRNPLPAVCGLIVRGDELLLVQRAVEPCRGQWSLPGGFIELGETTEEALVREIREETALDVHKLRLIGVSTQNSLHYGGVTVLGYAVEEWSGVPHPDSDALDIRFYARDERPPLPFPAHRELLAIFDGLRAGRNE